jgi:hypothetical protein
LNQLLSVISYLFAEPNAGQFTAAPQKPPPESGVALAGVGLGVGGTAVAVGVGFAITLLKKLNPLSGPAN